MTWTNVDPDLYRHMASQGHNDLKPKVNQLPHESENLDGLVKIAFK